jgi:hypothetical protein
VNEHSYMGAHKLKLTVGDTTRVNLKEDDPAIPYMEDFCISVKRLTELPVGEEARVICLVKDEAAIDSFTGKEGKALRKKVVMLCDPIEKVEVDIVLWN